eukprot:TRINITY_DN5407_c0_g2_i6.p1 TRINITY_DN5407_c0_g2~~TRINITY_DN5407_c0_g2_i6.p1  ORF type:complete len:405 (-),score=18.25 TRINITY_DN5407_c0_g2_i6:627-1841(-)
MDESGTQKDTKIVTLSNWEKSVEVALQSQDEANQFRKKLPGQIISAETVEFEECQVLKRIPDDTLSVFASVQNEDTLSLQTSTQSEEFNIEDFRYQGQNLQPEKHPEIQIVERTRSEVLKFWILEFDIEKIQQRNKDPIFFIKVAFICGLTRQFLQCIIFVVGLNFETIPTLVTAAAMLQVPILNYQIINTSIIGRPQIKVQSYIAIIIYTIEILFLFIYSFLVSIPFNSLPLYLLTVYIYLISETIVTAIMFTPNSTSWEDPSYQLKFLFERAMIGFFNGASAMDVSSDIVLSVKLFQKWSTFYVVSGVILILLCFIDFLLFVKRIVMPHKSGIREYFLIIFVEVVILSMTAVVLYGVSNRSLEVDSNWETFFVTIISLVTTLVNFLHHLIVVYDKIVSRKQF